MYLLPISLITLIAGAMLNSVSAEAEPIVTRVSEIIPPPTVNGEEAPPPHLIELQEKLRHHPGQRRAEQRVCEAQWGIMLGKSNYYPKLNATLSGGSKWIDHTTRADEFGGSNSPEYDGDG